MIRLPPIFTRTYTLCPYTTLFRSRVLQQCLRLCEGGTGLLFLKALFLRGFQPDQPCPGCRSFRLEGVARRGSVTVARRTGGGDRAWWTDARRCRHPAASRGRSEEHTSELQSLMRSSYAVFCLKKKNSYDYTARIMRILTTHT